MSPFRILPLLFLFSGAVQAAAPSGEDWQTLRTANFRVHHTALLEPYARHFAWVLERALPLLEKNLRWKAPTPVDIVVMDPSDSANGLAISFPNTHIEVFSAPFEHDSPLSHYFDWVSELATHELTHIVANDSALGYYLTLRKIFGSWVKPNGLQPTWLIEGLAVYQETRFTSAGRGRSPWLEAILREAVNHDRLNSPSYTSLDRFNDGNPWWPGGNTAYLLGYTIQALAEKDHADLPGEFSFHNGSLFPFMPDQNLRELTGRDWESVWAGATERLRARYGKTPSTENAPCFLTNSGRQTGGHALSPDGWVYFSEEDWDQGYFLSRVRADAPCGQATVERLARKDFSGPSQVAVAEDGATVAFAMYDRTKFEHFFSDLYLWHRDSGNTEQLTRGARARDPAFAGPYLFYLQQRPDLRHAIRRQLLATGEETEIYVAPPLARLTGLHARGGQLVFSRHDNQGGEKIFSLATQGGEAKALTPTSNLRYERQPHLAADGSLWFAAVAGSADQGIYRLGPDKQNKFYYQSPSGLTDRPVPLPGGQEILVQAYHLGGLDLARVPAVSGTAPAPTTPDLHEFLTGQAAVTERPPTEAELAALGPAEPYRLFSSPATSLWPQYWLPELAAADDGLLVGASTSGNDPLEYHRYGLRALYDSRARFPTYRVYYRNRTHPVNFHFEANQTNRYFLSTRSSNRNAVYSAEAIIPIGQAFFSVGGAFMERALFGRKGQTSVFYQQISYRREIQTPSALEPNHGVSVGTYLGLFPRARTEKAFADLRPFGTFYLPGFHPSHSVSVQGKMGVTTNRLLASNYYLGGGLSGLSDADFVVRGYPVDALFGQRIATVNVAYTLPLAHPYRGWGTNPLFLESVGLRGLADGGSANFVSAYRGKNFAGYEPQKLGQRWLTGFGLDLVTRGSIFYHIPLALTTGLHYGTQKDYGGSWLFFLGLNLGLIDQIPLRASARN